VYNTSSKKIRNMGLFSKLFGQSDKSTPADISKPQTNTTPCKTEQELIERYGGIALEKQLDFGEVIGNNNWSVNTTQATISFGQNLTFPMQVIGTISHSSQTWLWAWANTKSGLSESIIQQSWRLKKYGEENEIDLLRNDTFGFSKDKLHVIGIIASGMFNSSAYYIADYGQGAMVVTIKDNIVEKARTDSHHRILSVFPQLIAQFDMDHKKGLTNYLSAKGYTLTETEKTVTGTKNGNTITGQFDDLSRLTKLNG
jgi:hypothetical protein